MDPLAKAIEHLQMASRYIGMTPQRLDLTKYEIGWAMRELEGIRNRNAAVQPTATPAEASAPMPDVPKARVIRRYNKPEDKTSPPLTDLL